MLTDKFQKGQTVKVVTKKFSGEATIRTIAFWSSNHHEWRYGVSYMDNSGKRRCMIVSSGDISAS